MWQHTCIITAGRNSEVQDVPQLHTHQELSKDSWNFPLGLYKLSYTFGYELYVYSFVYKRVWSFALLFFYFYFLK